jgi:hypothetical protein
MKTYGGVDIQIHVFLTYVLVVGGELSASRPGNFTPGERTLGIHWIRGWMGPRTGLDDVKSGKSGPYRNSNSDPSTVQPVASRYTD